MNRLHAALAALLALVASGCLSLSSTTLSGEGLRHPVSFSKSLIDAEGRTRRPAEGDVLAHFERKWSHWGMLYDSISLSSDVDLAAVLEEEIEKAGGDGIVNLEVTCRGTGFSWFVSLLILFPECVKVTVEGDVVRLDA